MLPPVCEIRVSNASEKPMFSTSMSGKNLEKSLLHIPSKYIRDIVRDHLNDGSDIQTKELDMQKGEISENELVVCDKKGDALFYTLNNEKNEVKLIGARSGLTSLETQALITCGAPCVQSDEVLMLCHAPGIEAFQKLVKKGFQLIKSSSKTPSVKSATLAIDQQGILSSFPNLDLQQAYWRNLEEELSMINSVEINDISSTAITVNLQTGNVSRLSRPRY